MQSSYKVSNQFPYIDMTDSQSSQYQTQEQANLQYNVDESQPLDQLSLTNLAFESSANGIMLTDANHIIMQVNPAFTRISGFSSQSIVGKKPFILRSGEHDESFYNRIWKTLELDGRWQGEVCYRHFDGHLFYVWQTITCVYTPSGQLAYYISDMTDMSLIKQQQSALIEFANYDRLTKLPNKHYLAANLEQSVQLAQRNQTQVGLIFINIKCSSQGYQAKLSDCLLTEAASRIRAAVRKQDTCIRYSDNEFAVLVPNLLKPAAILPLVERIGASFEQPIDATFNNNSRFIANMGIATFTPQPAESQVEPCDKNTVNDLIEQANQAMYLATENEQLYQFYSTEKLNQWIK
ncbi:diguanylate cyclase domain-containing protein [Aliikangiella sp. IMCC44632]